jgi:hypothetical protein
MAGKTDTIPDLSGIEISDISGLWEVIRIYQGDEQLVSYPWIKDRFKFNFLSEKIFLCLRDGKTIHGNWELVEKTYESQKQHSIVLNGIFDFIIIENDEDEMTLSDRRNNYLLVRRL